MYKWFEKIIKGFEMIFLYNNYFKEMFLYGIFVFFCKSVLFFLDILVINIIYIKMKFYKIIYLFVIFI